MLSSGQIMIMILTIALGTFLTRVLPFVVFPADKPTPRYVLYLGKVLPYASGGFLVIYCLKEIRISIEPYAIPEIIAILCIAMLHKWKSSALLSIGAGTLLYMMLVQFVF